MTATPSYQFDVHPTLLVAETLSVDASGIELETRISSVPETSDRAPKAKDLKRVIGGKLNNH
jgi:hypothetical protein